MMKWVTTVSEELPFRASWIDRLLDWVEQRPWNPSAFYLALGLLLVLVQVLFLYLDAGRNARELLPVLLFNGFSVPYLLALMLLLDRQAAAALISMTAVLDLGEQELQRWQYRLATMPFLGPLLAGLAMMILTILTPLVSTTPIRYAALAQLPLFAAVFQPIDKLSAFLFGVFLYHTVRQLRLVHTLNSRHVRIRPSQGQPLQAFSKLTASTALGLVFFFYGWMLINPELLADLVIFGYAVAITILAVVVFVWPLRGIHRLMETQKAQALHENELRFTAVFALFNRHIAAGDYAAADQLQGLITALEIQQQRISATATWPWRSETTRAALTAIGLPLLLMILQFFIQQALNR